MPLDCMEKYNTGHQRDPYQGEKTHSTAAAGSKSNFRDFNRMTLKNCAIMAAKGKNSSQPFPLAILVLPETNFRLVSKNENL